MYPKSLYIKPSPQMLNPSLDIDVAYEISNLEDWMTPSFQLLNSRPKI